MLLQHWLSRDLVLTLRNYFIAQDEDQERFIYDLDRDDYDELRWSWNNFLSVSNSSDWKRIRKEGLLVTLDQNDSLMYLTNEEFRDKIRSMIQNTYHQLSLCVFLYAKNFIDFDLTLLCNLRRLKLKYLKGTPSLPRLVNIYHLELASCSDLIDISSLENVTSILCHCCYELLQIDLPTSCKHFEYRGTYQPFQVNINNLKSFSGYRNLLDFRSGLQLERLSLDYRSERHSENNNQIIDYLSDIPSSIRFLKGIAQLKCSKINLNQFPELETLIGCDPCYGRCTGLINFDEYFLPKEQLPTSTAEIPQEHQEVCNGLESTIVQHDPNKNVLHPKLKTLVAYNIKIPKYLFFNDAFPQLRYLYLPGCTLEDNEIYLPNYIRSFSLSDSNLKAIHGIDPNRRYWKVSLTRCNSLDSSILYSLRNVSRLHLSLCDWLRDITPIKDIPYLQFHHCYNIEDFSCLGSQRSLSISHHRGLNDSDLERFVNIPYLNIAYCPSITNISMFQSTRVLSFYSCDRLRHVRIVGNHHYVHLLNEYLKAIKVEGKVHELHFYKRRKKLSSEVINPENVIHLRNHDS